MDEVKDGYAYLERLGEQNRQKRPGFQDYYRYLTQKARQQGIPLDGQFELTPLCNFNCRMCYVHLTRQQMLSRPLLTVEQWKALMEQAVEAGMLSATLTGGECLTYPDFEELYLYLQDRGVSVTVMTNGSLLDAHWLDFFRAHPPEQLCITLYGSSEDAYERVTGQRMFETVVRHIRAIREAGVPLWLNVTPNPFTGEDALDTLRLAKSLCPVVRVSSWLSIPREETGRDAGFQAFPQELYIRLFRLEHELDGEFLSPIPAEELPEPGGPCKQGEVRGLLCGGGRSSFSIDWQGRMSPCFELACIREYPLEAGFLAAWQRINRAAESWPRAAECEGCAYAAVCERCEGHRRELVEPGQCPKALCERTKCYVQQGVYPFSRCDE